MTVSRLIAWMFMAGTAAALAALFLLYQNPVFEIYLTQWGLC